MLDDFIKLAPYATIIVAFFSWCLNEYSKRKQELLQRKESRYIELLKSIKGFYEEGTINEKRIFVNNYPLCFMYCSKDVIRKMNSFLGTVHADNIHNFSQDESQKKFVEFVLAIRKDLNQDDLDFDNSLSIEDYMHIRVIENNQLR